MIRLLLVDHEGNAITPEKLETSAELREAQERARSFIRECERLLDLKNPRKASAGVPYG